MNEPKCRHKRRGIVTSGEHIPGEMHATTNCCDRPSCIDDAIRWVNQMTQSRTGHYISDGAR